MAERDTLLKVTGLHKSYNVPVLADFDFELLRGEVHALVGSNGAGKSTFARIVCGLTARDRGSMLLQGAPYSPTARRDAEDAGVIMVLQELNVIGTLSIAENIFLDRLPRTAGFVRYARLNAMAREALARVGMQDIDPALSASRWSWHQRLTGSSQALRNRAPHHCRKCSRVSID